MTEIIETISNTEIIKLLLGVLERIKEKVQKNYSDELYVARMAFRRWYEYDPVIYRKVEKKEKILRIFSHKVEEIDKLVEIETDILKKTGIINVTISDAFISPIAKKEIENFVESHKEAGIKKIIFINNFSASP